MNQDNDHTTTNFTLYPKLLSELGGYRTHALGKWDVGYMVRNATATYRGFESFYGYYLACNTDYWYHTVPQGGECGPFNGSLTDWSDNALTRVGPADMSAINNTYNRELLSSRAANIITAHNTSEPLFMYLAFMNAHEGCSRSDKLGVQAPLSYVKKYNTTVLDTYKIMGGMLTELDDGVQAVLSALREKNMYDNTLIVFVSDNGGPLEHSANFPLRGGKHTFWDGGLRVEAFVSGGLVPVAQRGTAWDGLAHASDWYLTLTEGLAGLAVDPSMTGGPRPLDGFNLWPAILAGGPSPRTEVVHQVNNSYFSENVSSIRVGDFKIIRGPAGDNRTIAWPERSTQSVPIGLTGAVIEPGTDHVRGTQQNHVVLHRCSPFCLFNLSADPGENVDLAGDPAYTSLAHDLLQRLDFHGSTGPPPAYIWPDRAEFQKIVKQACVQLQATGTTQPTDWQAL